MSACHTESLRPEDLAMHPTNKSGLVAWDLARDPGTGCRPKRCWVRCTMTPSRLRRSLSPPDGYLAAPGRMIDIFGLVERQISTLRD